MAEIKNNMEIIVDDGSQRVAIKDKYGREIGVFFFHPTDVGIIERFNKIAGEFDKITEPLANVDISANGTTNGDDAQSKALAEAEKRLCDAVNYLFGSDCADAFFGSMHPFSPVNGVFYCENALNALGNYISAQFEAETKKFSKRVEKYTARYVKGNK